MIKAYYFNISGTFLKDISSPNNRCYVGQEPISCFQLKINVPQHFKGHFSAVIVAYTYGKKINQ